MQILSYRGPNAPGGVSNAITQIYEQNQNGGDWWYVDGEHLRTTSEQGADSTFSLNAELSAKHYGYCNNFLWPVLHDLPDHAHYSEDERQCYKAFNSAVAFRLRRAANQDGYFVNDYQFALTPKLLKGVTDTFAFWHIPFPANVRPDHVDAMIELAEGLLHANVVGFHTDEYKQNFFRFVSSYMNSIALVVDQHSIVSIDRTTGQRHSTRFVVSPLGIDGALWGNLAKVEHLHSQINLPEHIPFILSIDRADYTKGIVERIDAIEQFFADYPQWREKVVFVQVGTRSRPGLPEFDRYWSKCQKRLDALNLKYGKKHWQPLVWINATRSSAELAGLYSRAAAMIVSPVRDGLNLTAKEFIACQRLVPTGSANAGVGVLALSPGAGVWHELGNQCVAIEPGNKQAFALSILACLTMSQSEKYKRLEAMKESLAANSLDRWWDCFETECRRTVLSREKILERICG